MYLPWFMWPTPAATGAKVRTIGTKRARMIVSPPNRSKNAFVRSTFLTLKSPHSLRSKTFGPPLMADHVADLAAEERREADERGATNQMSTPKTPFGGRRRDSRAGPR